MQEEILKELQKVKRASRQLVKLTDEQIASVLNELADLALENEAFILEENKKDLDRMDPENPKYDRLLLNAERLKGITDDLRNVASLPSPLNISLESRKLDNGLDLSRVTVPLGTIGIIFESRPNVTFDVFALCLKSGNACVLKGSRDAKDSNIAIVKLIKQVLSKYGVEEICYLAPAEREALPFILNAVEYIDCAIPRGSQGLIDFVRENAKIPVIETGAGICHTYVDSEADIEKAKNIVTNAKARRVSVCNALDCLVLHQDHLEDVTTIMSDMSAHNVEVYADEASYKVLEGNYPANLLKKATTESFGTEFLSHKMAIKTVVDVEEALDHVAAYTSKHSEAIVTENKETADYYLKNTDAACVYANASTAFSDGAQFGLGAEIGISTQKLHARGPMALRELTSYKWVIVGDGHTRA
ncbi:MAG: glutamate-5-semialdehyde dehydrogenase [Cytophagales bacterium]|nr:glutamate-5-semialdehyde dehydrogenase [Cytophagales bacterium]